MGFLDKFLTKEAKKLISNVVDNVVDNVADTINDTINPNQYSYTDKNTAANSNCFDTIPDEEPCEYEKSVICHRIEKVAAEEWSGYELRKNIPAAEMGAQGRARDYSYGLYLNGVPKAMIIIMEKGGYRDKDTRLSHDACRNQNVFCMNLMTHLPNRRSYISQQLRDNVAR